MGGTGRQIEGEREGGGRLMEEESGGLKVQWKGRGLDESDGGE